MNMGIQAINSGYYAQMMNLPMGRKVMSPTMSPANPQTCNAWMGAVANPATYPMMQMVPMELPTAGMVPASGH